MKSAKKRAYMDLTYMVRGADGKEYGPASLQQLSGWIQEGRVPAKQEVKRSDMDYWATAGDFTELQPAFGVSVASTGTAVGLAPSPAGAAVTPATEQVQAAAVAQVRSGGSWFYWVAGLSLVNSILAFSGSTRRFLFGLGITQIFDALGSNMGSSGNVIALVLDILAAGVFVAFGVFAVKGHSWAFVSGMVLFALDALIFLLFQSWLAVGFHVFVLYCLMRGFSACRRLKQA